MRGHTSAKILGIIAALAIVAAACGSDSPSTVDTASQDRLDQLEANLEQAQADAAAAQAAADAAAESGGDVDTSALEAELAEARADAAAAQEAAEAAQAAADAAGGAQEETKVVRFAFAPDPAWDWLRDTGELANWEEANNIRIVTSETWDEFTYFAGGHGDIVSMGTQEIPVLEQNTSVETVTFGKYNYQRSPMLKRAGDPYETLADVPEGSNICVSSPVSNTGFWTVAVQELHGIDYRVGGGDYNLIVNDHFVNPTNLLRGDCEAAVIIPEAAAPHIREGEIEFMYDGQMPFQLYKTFSGIDDGQNHIMSNLFTATAEWYDANQETALKFLELWQLGVDLWNDNVEEIVTVYPQHFAVEEDEDVEWMIEFMQGDNDWFVDSVYLDQEWVDAEIQIWELMKTLTEDNPNVLAADAPTPRFEILGPA